MCRAGKPDCSADAMTVGASVFDLDGAAPLTDARDMQCYEPILQATPWVFFLGGLSHGVARVAVGKPVR